MSPLIYLTVISQVRFANAVHSRTQNESLKVYSTIHTLPIHVICFGFRLASHSNQNVQLLITYPTLRGAATRFHDNFRVVCVCTLVISYYTNNLVGIETVSTLITTTLSSF